METEKPTKGRYPKGHPREGGYCVLWAKQTLESEKLKNPMIAGCFFKVLAVAQLVDYETGRFERGGMPFSAGAIANKAGITTEQFNFLLIKELVVKEAINGEFIFSIKSWIEHQNPKNGFKLQKESPLNGKTAVSFNNHHSSNSSNIPKRSKYKSEKIDNSPKQASQ